MFELYNNRKQEVEISSASQGLPTSYRKTIHENNIRINDPDFFSLFGLSITPVVKYIDYLITNYEDSVGRWTKVRGFKVVKRGRYIFEINLIVNGNIKGFNCQVGGKQIEFIERNVKKEIAFDLEADDFVFVFPEPSDTKEDFNFTIEPQSYVKVTYSWKHI